MSGRRSANRIRGPQSALTDFLAANNISAAQIRSDYERRRQTTGNDSNNQDANNPTDGDNDANVPSVDAEHNDDQTSPGRSDVALETTAKKRKRNQKSTEKILKEKTVKSKKASKKKRKGDDSEDYESDSDHHLYKKARPAPGQFGHCEECQKRFTVTPYSKEGANGGLLCTACGKLAAKDSKVDRTISKKSTGRKRRKIESERLDGIVGGGAKSLQDLCIQRLAEHHNEIEELGDVPEPVLERLAQIFAKRRVLRPKTLPLFLRPGLESVVIHDAAYLEVDDYRQICAIVPNMKKLVLSNACQLKDEVVEYMIGRCHKLEHLQLYAANLVTDQTWLKLFEAVGQNLRVLKLKWLDAALGDEAVHHLIEYCPDLERIKFKHCRHLGNAAVIAVSRIARLRHVSLLLNKDISNATLMELMNRKGSCLETLSLEKFIDADDSVLDAIRQNCRSLCKFRLSENDTATDAGFAALFQDWENPPLSFADFSSTRDIDNNNPNGPENPVGLANNGFQALMSHSGSTLKHLDVASCRHIPLRAFGDVFNGSRQYPLLEYINISFCSNVDTSVVAGVFKSCPRLKKLVAFGCFDVHDVIVPRGIALIGVPKAQDAIEQFGIGLDVEEAIGRMVEVGA